MIKDAKYIIKRIIIGVGIALVLSFLTACKVNAQTVTPSIFQIWTNGGTTWNSNVTSYSSQSIGGTYFNIVSHGSIFGPMYRLYFTPAKTGTYFSGYFFLGNTDTITGVTVTSDNPSIYCTTSNISTISYNNGLNISGSSVTTKFGYYCSSPVDANITAINIYVNYLDTNNTINTIGFTDLTFYNASEVGSSSAIQNEVNQTKEEVSNIKDSINDDDVTDADDTASSFFDDFSSDSHGLTGIITAPLSMIQSITSSSCSPLTLPLPFVNEDLTLPCMSSIYSQYFGSFFTMYQIITFGIISYWVCVKIFALVKGFKDPNDDRIEVLDL